MNLSSEQVHWVGGGAAVIVATALLLREAGLLSVRWVPWLLPIFLVGYGIESFLDPWVHGKAAPADYGAESAQHVLQGSAMLAAGIVEGLRLRGTLSATAWSAALPIALVILAVVFLLHAQHAAAVPALVIQVQHRAFALTLLLTALARGLLVLRSETAQRFAPAWLFLFLLFGLELLTYTESGPTGAPHREHH